MEAERLVLYIFLTGFLSGSAFMYTGLMMFMSGMATGVVVSRAGWVDTIYAKFNNISAKEWNDLNVHLSKVFVNKTQQ